MPVASTAERQLLYFLVEVDKCDRPLVWEHQFIKKNLGPTSVDEDIVASKLEEGRHVLEDERERVRLPVIGIVGKLDSSLDF